ncbi:pentatricopeptide repeat protein [Ophiostoma piceae UAMH 11346]|uniref:Pentatricopeptide repeat protein n=1 Tax=Ophiostoma piceae (strain UAMH 11346) TaxID=1262450 RepID=S3D978_OPHP1|nr:pentatricopeptide repeat protein [Ophiostoma piceae UAMH 11346]
MQTCPCVRLRLWRQYGRDWHRLRNASPATLARAASTMYQHSPNANPVDLLDNKSKTGTSWDATRSDPELLTGRPPRITFYKSKNTLPTRKPWSSAGSPEDSRSSAHPTADEIAAWSLVDWRFFISGPRNGTPMDRPTHLFAGQLHFLKKEYPPNEHKEVVRRFNQWKEAVATTWCMLENKQLPCELNKEHSSILRRILEQEQVHASSDEAWLAGAEGEAHGRAERIRKLWSTLTQEEREAQWPHLLISTFRTYPELILDIFHATFETSAAPLYVIEDTLSYIVRSNESANVALKLSFDDIFSIVKLSMEKGRLNAPLHLRQHTLYALLRATKTPHDASSLFNLLQGHGQPIHANTLIQFTARLAKSPEHKAQAVDMVRLMVSEHSLDINSVKGSALCTTILSSGWGRVLGNNNITPAVGPANGAGTISAASSSEQEHSGPTPAQLFEQLLGIGLEPNLITYTAIIRELCSKGELTSAQEVLQIMLNTQTGLDAYVYSILMNGAKAAGHYPLIRQVAEAAASNRILHPYVWNDFLQAIHVMALSEARSDPAYKRPRMIPAFPLMLETYRKTFSPAPLLELLPFVSRLGNSYGNAGIGMNSSAATRRRWEFVEELGPTLSLLPQLSPADMIAPTGVTLSTMVLGYIQGLSNPYDVIEFYSHFHRLLKTGHPVAISVVEETGSMVYDIVIMALCEYDGMLRVALDVVSDMLRDASLGLDDHEPLPGQRKDRKRWNKAEPNKEQAQSQEQQSPVPAPDTTDMAHAVMPGVHSPPSVHTWSILLNGFMFHRHTMQGERILKMMAKRGIEPNEVTWNTLISGYARLQFARKTGNALLRRELAGYEPNDFTFRAFSYLGDKAIVIKYLERHREVKQNTPAPSSSGSVSATTARNRHPAIARELRSLKEDIDGIAQMMNEDEELPKQPKQKRH